MKKLTNGPLVTICVFALILVLFCFWLSGFQQDNHERQRQVLEETLNRNILNCYSLHGRYPKNLAQLLEIYPIVYDTEHFAIDYRFLADNLLPEVTILDIP